MPTNVNTPEDLKRLTTEQLLGWILCGVSELVRRNILFRYKTAEARVIGNIFSTLDKLQFLPDEEPVDV